MHYFLLTEQYCIDSPLYHKQHMALRLRYYLRQGGYVIVVLSTCLFVCLSVRNFPQKLPNGFA